MSTNILYDIYKLNHETEGEDLTISLAKYKAEHPMDQAEDKAIREFVGRHGKALAMAFRKGKAAFEAAAEVLWVEDQEQ